MALTAGTVVVALAGVGYWMMTIGSPRIDNAKTTVREIGQLARIKVNDTIIAARQTLS